MVWDYVFGFFKPPSSSLVKNLSFEGNGCENSVKGRLSIRGNQGEYFAKVIPVANFSLVMFFIAKGSSGEAIIEASKDDGPIIFVCFE